MSPSDDSPKNWTEDFDHENGNYINRCFVCDKEFMGHKRRVVCKQCHNFNSPNTWLRCNDCKCDVQIPIDTDPLTKVYCEVCNMSHMRMFWIELGKQS